MTNHTNLKDHFSVKNYLSFIILCSLTVHLFLIISILPHSLNLCQLEVFPTLFSQNVFQMMNFIRNLFLIKYYLILISRITN